MRRDGELLIQTMLIMHVFEKRNSNEFCEFFTKHLRANAFVNNFSDS